MCHHENIHRLNTDPERVGFVWCTLCGRRCFWGGTVGRGRAAPSPGPWHTGRRRPGTPGAAAVWQEPSATSEQRFDEPGSTHPVHRKEFFLLFTEHFVNQSSDMIRVALAWYTHSKLHISQQDFFTADISVIIVGKAGVPNNIYNSSILSVSQHAQYQDLEATKGIQPSLIVFCTPAFLLLWHVKLSSVKKAYKKWWKSETDIDNEAAELKLFRCDDVMVTGLLGQLHDGSTCGQPQTRHVWLTARRKKQQTGQKDRKEEKM